MHSIILHMKPDTVSPWLCFYHLQLYEIRESDKIYIHTLLVTIAKLQLPRLYWNCSSRGKGCVAALSRRKDKIREKDVDHFQTVFETWVGKVKAFLVYKKINTELLMSCSIN